MHKCRTKTQRHTKTRVVQNTKYKTMCYYVQQRTRNVPAASSNTAMSEGGGTLKRCLCTIRCCCCCCRCCCCCCICCWTVSRFDEEVSEEVLAPLPATPPCLPLPPLPRFAEFRTELLPRLPEATRCTDSATSSAVLPFLTMFTKMLISLSLCSKSAFKSLICFNSSGCLPLP